MGNCCTKEPTAFSSPGRPLGSAPSGPSSVGVPASAARPPPKVGGPPRTLGGGGGTAGGVDAEEARRKAAAAAEARAQNAKVVGGDLSKKLADQRKLTQRATLEEASRKNLREREVDASADTLRNS